jgi:hypothetical protein
LSLSGPASTSTLNQRIEEEKRNVRLYADAIALYASIRLTFQHYGFAVHVEPTVKLVADQMQVKVPDLLVATKNGWTLLEHKGSLPMEKDLISGELKELAKYDQSLNYDKSIFQPDVVLLCPSRLATDLMPRIKELQLPTVISYSAPTEKNCTLTQVNGTLKDGYLRDLFDTKSNEFKMSTDTVERYKYKFIRREPPVPYTTHFIWGFINLSKDAFQKKVTVSYDQLIERINDLCPPWCAEARQLSEGRLNKVIRFLQHLGWIKFDRHTREIVADTSRGTKAGRMEEYLCDRFARFSEGVPPGKELGKEEAFRIPPLEEFFS